MKHSLSKIATTIETESPLALCNCTRPATFTDRHAATCPVHQVAVKIIEGFARLDMSEHKLKLLGV